MRIRNPPFCPLNYRGKFREIITSAKTAFNAVTRTEAQTSCLTRRASRLSLVASKQTQPEISAAEEGPFFDQVLRTYDD